MSTLWTPYADDVLDLSKATIKTEPPSPAPTPQTSPPVPYGYYIPAQLSPVLHPPEYFASQMKFQYGYVPQISPSSSSGYDENFQQFQRTSLSPPDSPESEPSRHSLIDVSKHLIDDPGYQAFERDALRAMAEKNGGSLLGNNPRMRRSVRSTKETADDGYRQQRERNNFAAKQSRDRRKLRELKLALKVTYLEKEARKLKALLATGVCARCNPYQEPY